MGNPMSQLVKEQKEHDEQIHEMLLIASKMLQNKIAATAAKLEAEAYEDSKLPVVAIVNKSEKYLVKVSEAPAEEIGKVLDDVLSGDFLSGLKDVVRLALNVFLGDESEGESEKNDTHVVFADNSLLRVDYYVYKHGFSSNGVLKEAENSFCYYLQVGVLDMEKVNPQVLLYELSRAIKDDEFEPVQKRLQKISKFAKQLYNIIPSLDKAQAMGPLPKGERFREGEDDE